MKLHERTFRIWWQGNPERELVTDTFEVLSGDYDFGSEGDKVIEALEALEVGEQYDDDGIALWTRFPDNTKELPISAEMEMSTVWVHENRNVNTATIPVIRAEMVAYMRQIEKEKQASDIIGIFLDDENGADLNRMNEAVRSVLEGFLLHMAEKLA